MPVPIYPGKHALPALFQPADYPDHVAYVGLQGQPVDWMPERAILVYSQALLRQVTERYKGHGRVRPGFVTYRELEVSTGTVAVVGGFGVGGPAAAITLEEIIAAGVRQAISVGGAGGLQPGQQVGDLVVCSSAIRDEGVSYHYLPPDDRSVEPDHDLTARLLDAVFQLEERVAFGSTWTTDALYRETRDEVRHYGAEGVLTVEMEAASLAAVALHRGIAFAAAFSIMDLLAGDAWEPDGFGHPFALVGLNTLFDAAVAAMA
ncbi:MAG TPA: nucleoside phosphorylase [Kribbellaceae bacterium]|nr:nucleoside phosphorylase [Kribbellaceae bacterium]